MDAIFYILDFVAVVTVLFAWYKILSLRKRVPGGVVRAVCNVLSEFIGLFALGFLAFSFFPLLPEMSREIMLGFLTVGAAACSIMMINFFSEIAAEAGF